MLFKLIILIVILFVIYNMFFKKKQKKRDSGSEEILIECAKCETFISRKEALISQGKYYCSEECLNKQ